MDLKDVQEQQAKYDEKYWLQKPGFETIRHTSHHLAKLVGKVSGYCENVEDNRSVTTEELDTEVIPDLLIYAARLANDRGVKLDEAFTNRKLLLERLNLK